ncbi:MAG: hypothetical protein DHS20C12_16650 [Pseudohongiella sp.]|nr:MAG: hypothetical protein DHS20C12_16650 [Pseudohongiella sp.]
MSIRFVHLRTLLILSWSLSLVACTGLSLADRPANDLYCDNFLLYEMCARDSNGDGVVDYTYFADSNEIFMYRERLPRRIPAGLAVHRCVMPMEEDLVETTSRLFYLDEDSSLLDRTDIRGAMMIKYIAKLPEVTACNMRAEEASTDEG